MARTRLPSLAAAVSGVLILAANFAGAKHLHPLFKPASSPPVGTQRFLSWQRMLTEMASRID